MCQQFCWIFESNTEPVWLIRWLNVGTWYQQPDNAEEVSKSWDSVKKHPLQYFIKNPNGRCFKILWAMIMKRKLFAWGKKIPVFFFNGCSVGIQGYNQMSAPSCSQCRERWPFQLSAFQWDDKTIDREAYIIKHAGSFTRLFKFMFCCWDKWKKEPCR